MTNDKNKADTNLDLTSEEALQITAEYNESDFKYLFKNNLHFPLVEITAGLFLMGYVVCIARNLPHISPHVSELPHIELRVPPSNAPRIVFNLAQVFDNLVGESAQSEEPWELLNLSSYKDFLLIGESLLDKIYAIDGKQAKGGKFAGNPAVHMLNVFATNAGISIAQCDVDKKTNKI